MHIKTVTSLSKFTLIFLSLVGFNAEATFYDSRIQKWELYLAPQITNSKDIKFDNGAQASLNQRSSIGFGIGYNINSHIELSLDFSSSNSNYTSTSIPEDASLDPVINTHSLYTSSINFGFTFNFLSTPFTPYVTANAGSTYIDSGILTGNIGTGCWWYPYWGYYCGPVAQTYTSTEFNYGAALGLRYDFNRKLYIKAQAGKNYLDTGNTPDFTTYRFIFGFMF